MYKQSCVLVVGLVSGSGSAGKVRGHSKATRPLPASQSEQRLWWTANDRVAWWPLMKGPPLASSLNNSAGGKMADIQHCRDGEKEGEGRDGCRGRQMREWAELWFLHWRQGKGKNVKLENTCLFKKKKRKRMKPGIFSHSGSKLQKWPMWPEGGFTLLFKLKYHNCCMDFQIWRTHSFPTHDKL